MRYGVPALRRPDLTLLALVVVVVTIAAFEGCKARTPPAEETTTVWQRRGAWTGHGLVQTEPFISTTGLLRLIWETRGASKNKDGSFRITVHSDVSGRPLMVAVDRHAPGKDVTYVTEDPRTFFLLIESEGFDWSVEVAEGLPATKVPARR